MVKSVISITFEQDLLKVIDVLAEKEVRSRSATIEYYVRLGLRKADIVVEKT